jgi:uncharacterized membrane protein YqgA involved in biofilm formation
MKETILLIFVAISSLFILGYSIHMLIGGLVDAATERWIIAAACLAGGVIVVYMGWDILRHRRRR